MDAALLDEAEEGPRMAKLREVVGKALTAAARGVKPAMLAEALPDVAAKDGKLLDALREEAVAAIGASTEVTRQLRLVDAQRYGLHSRCFAACAG